MPLRLAYSLDPAVGALSRYRQRYELTAGRIEAFFLAHSELLARVLLVSISCLFLGFTGQRASEVFLWYDEIFTELIVNLPNMGEIWRALANGIDQNPPLFYGLTKLSVVLLGESPLALRLPAVLGFWVFGLCVYRFTRERFGQIAGLTAILLTYMTWAYAEAAFTARPYGLLLGAFGLALVSWQHAASRQRRRLSLVGLSLGLAVALLSHCYAVMLFVPIVLGEMTRSALARRMDWPVWVAILAPAPLVVAYLPILEGASSVLANTWGSPRWTQPLDFHRSTINSLVMPLTAIALVAGAAAWRLWNGNAEWPRRSRFTAHEAAAVAGLLLLPLLGVVLGKAVTGIFTERYAMAALAGYVIILGAAAGLHRAAGPFWGAGLVAILMLWWVKTEWRFVPQSNPALGLSRASLPDRRDLPIVVTRGMLFFELARHSPPETLERIVYPVAPSQAIRFSNTDLFDVGLPMINEYFGLGLSLPGYKNFVDANKAFILYGPFAETSYDKSIWIVDKLLEDGARVTLLNPGKDGEPAAFVEMPNRSEK